MGSMNPYSNWPIPPYIQQCRQQQPFGGLYPGSQSQQAMNYWAGICPGYGSTRPEDLRQIEEWKCGHCGSRFETKVEKCKNCGSNAILRFDDHPGLQGRQESIDRAQDLYNAFVFGPIGIPPKQQSVSEAVAEFRQEVANITTGSHIRLTKEAVEYLYPRCWLSRCWSRFLAYLDGCGYRR